MLDVFPLVTSEVLGVEEALRTDCTFVRPLTTTEMDLEVATAFN